MMILISMFLGFSFLNAAQAAQPVHYSYLARVQATEATCEAEGKKLEDKLAQTKGVSEAQVECRGTINLKEDEKTHKLYSLFVSYFAEWRFPYSANYQIDILRVPYSSDYPAYSSYSECLAELPEHKEIYEKETGLEAVISTCEKVEFALDPKYTIKIEGFGKPQKHLQFFSIDFDSEEQPDFYQKVEELIEAQKITIIKNFGQVVFFYEAEPIHLHNLMPLYFNSTDECKTQIQAATSLLDGTGSQHIRAFCSLRHESPVLYVVGIGSPYPRPPSAWQRFTYYTFDECLQDVPRLKAQHKRAKGVLCSADGIYKDRYQAQIFE